ncbi:MAG TPA: site-specific integrase, partial [Nitrososphaeraceae archaeon]
MVHHGDKVNTFLNSIGRKNPKTARSYSSALVLLDNFTTLQYPEYDYNTIIDAVIQQKINVYELLDKFVQYIQSVKVGITAKSIVAYLAALRSYFSYHDVDVIPAKFRRKVFMPRIHREDEQPLDAADIRRLLLNCNNRRLKVYLLVLASGGMRAVEALAIRNRDIDLSFNPAKIHIRAEYSKTKVGRDIYISEEATKYLKQWLEWKYKNPDRRRKFDKDDLVFTVYQT